MTKTIKIAVGIFLARAVISSVEFLATKALTGRAESEMSPMDRYRSIYTRVFNFVGDNVGVLDYSQAIYDDSDEYDFTHRRYAEIRAVRVSVVTASTIAAISTVRAIQDIYTTLSDELDGLPPGGGRLLPLAARDVRNANDVSTSPSDRSRLARISRVLIAAADIAKVIVLFEGLCISSAFFVARRFIKAPRPMHDSLGALDTEMENLYSQGKDGRAPTTRGELVAAPPRRMHTGGRGIYEKRRSSSDMALEISVVTNRYYSTLHRKVQEHSGFRVQLPNEYFLQNGGAGVAMFEKKELYGTGIADGSILPSHRRRNAALRKSVSSQSFSNNRNNSGRRPQHNKVVQRGRQAIAATPSNGYGDQRSRRGAQSPALAASPLSIYYGRYAQYTAAVGVQSPVLDASPFYYGHGGNRDQRSRRIGGIALAAVRREQSFAALSVDQIERDAIPSNAHNSRFDFSASDRGNEHVSVSICVSPAPVKHPVSSSIVVLNETAGGLVSAEEGTRLPLDPHAGSTSLGVPYSINAPMSAMDGTTVSGPYSSDAGMICTRDGGSGALVPSTSSGVVSAFSPLHSGEGPLRTCYAVASGLFLSCYAMVMMHLSLFAALRERYNDPTMRPRFSNLLYGDEVEVINSHHPTSMLSTVTYACRVALQPSPSGVWEEDGSLPVRRNGCLNDAEQSSRAGRGI